VKKIFLILWMAAAFSSFGFGQSNPPLKVREVDGTPTKSGINTLVVSNGSLTVSGTTATVTTGVSGLSDVSGTLVSSSNFRVPSGGSVSVTNLQVGTASTGFYSTGGNLAVSASGASGMLWNGANGNTTVNGSYELVFGSSGFSSPDVGIRRSAAGVVQVSNVAGGVGRIEAGGITLSATVFASLGTPANGAFLYCSDCTVANPCAGSGTGALAKRLNGAWVCN